MSAQIIPFTSPAPRRQEPPEKPQPCDFWFEILNGLSPRERQAAIRRALECQVIDRHDAEIVSYMWFDRDGPILSEMWPEREGA